MFGPKDYEWLVSMFNSLELVKFKSKVQQTERIVVYKLKLLAILVDLLLQNMIRMSSEKSIQILNLINQHMKERQNAMES